MVLAQGNGLLGDWVGRAACVFGGAAGKVIQGDYAAGAETQFPGVKGAAPDMRGTARQCDIAGSLPSLEQQPPLRGGRQRKVNSLMVQSLSAQYTMRGHG